MSPQTEKTLADHLRASGRLPVKEFVPLFRQVCEAIAAYHERSPAHGDVRPVNLKFTEEGRLRLEENTPPDPPRDYFAPEQLMGRRVTAATDIYSAGLVAYEMLTGRNPAAALDTGARTTGRPPQLSGDAPGVPAHLAKAIESCLEPEPGKRPASMRRLLDALGGGMPAPAPTPAAMQTVTPTVTPLAAILPEQPSDLGDAAPLFLQILRRVAKFHETRTAHVALCPRNIGIRESGDVEIEAGEPFLEPKYSSPETLLALAPTNLHLGSDIYALGFLFYEVLLGTMAFGREFAAITALNSDFQWAKWHADPSRRATPLRQARPDLPAHVAEMVDRMCAKDPQARPASLAEVMAVLQQADTTGNKGAS